MAKSTFKWFLSNGVPIVDWPAYTDLNYIENVWARTARHMLVENNATLQGN